MVGKCTEVSDFSWCQTTVEAAKNRELDMGAGLKNCNPGDTELDKSQSMFQAEKGSGVSKDKTHEVVKVAWREL